MEPLAKEVDWALFVAMMELLGRPELARPADRTTPEFRSLWDRIFLWLDEGGIGFPSVENGCAAAQIASVYLTATHIRKIIPGLRHGWVL
jgi:hypothetical protein